MSINAKIEISKDEILSKYNQLDDYFRKVILSLYGDNDEINLQCFYNKGIINFSGDNNITALKKYSNSTGVYIFLDKDNIPVYIGVSGKEDSKQPLKDRLGKQFNCGDTDSNLSQNIYEIEALYGNTLKGSTKEDRKRLILDYAPKLLVIDVGELSGTDNINTSRALEQVLISLFNSKYNK